MIKPGSRQAVAKLVFAYIAEMAVVKPIPPMVSPHTPGGMLRKQAE
jgi:hypothetical protein